MQGWRVLERLKNEIVTRHIPVCIVSTDESKDRALDCGAMSFVVKPIQNHDVVNQMLLSVKRFLRQKSRCVLIVDPDTKRRNETVQLLSFDRIAVKTAKDKREAARILKKQDVNCIITVPAMDLKDILTAEEDSRAQAVANRTPVIIYDESCEGYDKSHRKIQSSERLLDIVSYYLHCNVMMLPDEWREKICNLHQSNEILAGKKVLVVDDDARNIFALSSVLEEHEMLVDSADNGHDAIAILRKNPDIDIVLMDIMMPEMDGMETIREIRRIESLKNLPVIAVTAKAMKGDREKCIEAGAWDYLSKPVDIDQMLTVLRAWLFR